MGEMRGKVGMRVTPTWREIIPAMTADIFGLII